MRATTVSTAVTVPRIAAPRAGTTPARKAGPIIQSVDRALDILEALARGGKMSLAELSLKTGINASTCHHLVGTIGRRGYITQDPETRRYSLGSKIFQLSEARASQINLIELAMPFLARLNRKTGEATHLVVIEGTELITVAKLGSLHAVKVDSATGRSGAPHATAAGKAILAWLPPIRIDEILDARGMERFTAETITSRRMLIEELRLVRRYGYSEDREEFQPGVHCIGAAIRSHKGAVIGSISLSIPTMRVSADVLARARKEVMATAHDITKELGSNTSI
ncbi:MAG TPA: IclR family transcriptional regulator [Stellaceae bacterium]|nr:IclR family transcriptional regulator [Stellaceae bacterium]